MMSEPTLHDRAATALANLAQTMPSKDDVLAGAPLPEWMVADWLPYLTDPDDPRFATSVVKAEAWLATH
jgi:hypothetical protein